MMSVDLYVKLRDHHQAIADALNEELEKHAPPEVDEYDPEKILWTKATGPKGPYEMYPAFQQQPTQTSDYAALLEDLKNHEGKLQQGGLFYWLFVDGFTIGRKPAKR
jgi:hypothetical protein